MRRTIQLRKAQGYARPSGRQLLPVRAGVNPKYALASARTAKAQAGASLEGAPPHYKSGLVSARSTGPNGVAGAHSMMLVEIGDPQHRDSFSIDIQLKAAVNAQVGGTAGRDL